MSYEYSSAPGNERFSPPNPLRLQNYFLFAGGGLFLVLGIALLLVVRSMAADGKADAFGGMVVSAGMIAVGVAVLAFALTHLRFWFGRERPTNLNGHYVKEVLRQRALDYREPTGPLNGLLYSWIHDLIYSPAPIQSLAQRQFRNGLTMLALLVSLGFALLGGSSVVGSATWGNVSQWMGVVYLGFALKLLFSGTGIAKQQGAAIERNALVFLIVFSVAGPVLLSLIGALLPAIPWLKPYPHVFILLVAALIVYGLFFMAILKQTNGAPQTEVSCVQQAWSFNCQPSLVMGEFDRHMQENWRNQIPNRHYLRTDPKINVTAASGDFSAEALEETQPFPVLRRELEFKEAMAHPRFKLLLAMDAVALLCFALAAGFLFWFGKNLGGAGHSVTSLLDGIIFFSLGYFAFHASHPLWKRFDFDSRVVWLEMEGSYVSAHMEHGNVMHDTIKTRSNVVQIQSMTFRIWAASVNSVTFGVEGERYLLSLCGEPDFAEALTAHLREFAHNQAMILAPTSQADVERHAALAQLNQMSRSAQAAQASLPAVEPQLVALQDEQGEILMMPVAEPPATITVPETPISEVPPPAVTSVAAKFCSQCGGGVSLADVFCRGCGTRLQTA